MTIASRERLRSLVRRNDADLAEAALLCCVEVEPRLDVDTELLRLDALADGLRSRGVTRDEPTTAASELAAYLAGTQGFRGDTTSYHDPANGLLTRVLERKRGLPITLTIVYVAIARRVGIPAFLVNLPGHAVTGVGGRERPVLLDPFHEGMRLDEATTAERVVTATGGRLEFRRAMLRPAPAVNVVRRLLNNLTRDFAAADRPFDALWTVELKQLLPNRLPEDHRVHGQLLTKVGRFDEAAAAYEAYLELTSDEAPARVEARQAAIQARARMN
jgi:regulator of sirC expression with transglutaminase-like and TPR domain